MFLIDGVSWDVHCTITRVAEIKASEISGMMMDKSWFNDVLGTYMRYDITLDAPLFNRDKYARIYEMLCEPVDGHRFVLPYNNGYVEVTARVEKIEDTFVVIPNGRKFWKDTTFTIIANHPTRALSLSEVLTRGRAPLPDIADPAEGDTYTWKDGAWGAAETYLDADDLEY